MPLHPHFVMKILELSTRSWDLAGFIAPDGHVNKLRPPSGGVKIHHFHTKNP